MNLVMTVSTKMTSKVNEVERRNSKLLINRVFVQPCAEQVDTQVDTSLDNHHSAHFNTSERQLRGSLHLLEDTSEKSQLLSPPFTFAGLTIEVSVPLIIASKMPTYNLFFHSTVSPAGFHLFSQHPTQIRIQYSYNHS
jgi:hypothetical protein